MDPQKVKQQYRMQTWIELVQQCRTSGQSVASWCSDHQINIKQYYYWLRKIRQAACETMSPAEGDGSQLVPLSFSLTETTAATTSEDRPAIVLKIGDAALEIQSHASQELIARVVQALAYVR